MVESLFIYNLNLNMINPAYSSFQSIHYYQGVLAVEVALTLILFFVLRIVHYVKWGFDEEQGNASSAQDAAYN